MGLRRCNFSLAMSTYSKVSCTLSFLCCFQLDSKKVTERLKRLCSGKCLSRAKLIFPMVQETFSYRLLYNHISFCLDISLSLLTFGKEEGTRRILHMSNLEDKPIIYIHSLAPLGAPTQLLVNKNSSSVYLIYFM